MVTVKVVCECAQTYTGVGNTEFEAVTTANRKRAKCRDISPDRHAELRRQQQVQPSVAVVSDTLRQSL